MFFFTTFSKKLDQGYLFEDLDLKITTFLTKKLVLGRLGYCKNSLSFCQNLAFLVSGEETYYGGPVCLSVGQSIIDFLIFQKRGFESTHSNLSHTTKFVLLDSLLQDVTAIFRLPNPKLSTVF